MLHGGSRIHMYSWWSTHQWFGMVRHTTLSLRRCPFLLRCVWHHLSMPPVSALHLGVRNSPKQFLASFDFCVLVTTGTVTDNIMGEPIMHARLVFLFPMILFRCIRLSTMYTCLWQLCKVTPDQRHHSGHPNWISCVQKGGQKLSTRS